MVAQKLAAKPESASSQTEPAAVAFMGELDHPLNTEFGRSVEPFRPAG
jgi:hypothetical protein